MGKRTGKGAKLMMVSALLFALGGSFSFIGCNSDTDDDDGGTSVVINPSETETLVIGELSVSQAENADQTVTLTVTPNAEKTTAKDITYTFALAEEVTGVTLTAGTNGTATLANSVAEEKTVTVKVTASAANAADVTATKEVTLAAYGVTYNYEITLPEPTVSYEGKTATVTAAATVALKEGAEGETTPTVAYTFSLADGTSEDIAISSEGGVATVTNKGKTTQSVTVNVKASADGASSKSTSASVTVAPQTETLTLSAVTLSAASGSVEQGESTSVTASATVSSSDSARDAALSGELPTVTYKWESSVEGITFEDATAASATINVAITTATGDATVTVTASAEGAESTSATYTLTVVKAYPYTLYSQDYEATDATSDWTSSSGKITFTVVKNDDRTYLATNTAAASYTFTGPTVGLKAGNDFKLSCDVKIRNSNTDAGTSFIIYDEAESAAILKLSAAANAAGKVWNINGSAEQTVELETYGSVIDTETTPGKANTSWYSYWYSLLLERIGTDTYLTIIRTTTNETVFARQKIATLSDAGGVGTFKFDGTRYYTGFAIDNVVVKSTADQTIITSVAMTAKNATIDCDGTTTLDATATAALASGSSLTPTYAWSLADADASYATLSSTSGESVILTGTNVTSNDYTATVTCVVTAGAGNDVVTKTLTKSIKVLAKQSLLSDMTISAEDDATTVAAGSKLVLTLNGGTSSEENGTVNYAWSSSNEELATVEKTDTGATVTGIKDSTETVTITVTATLGSIKKTATYEVTVTASAAELATLTLSEERGSVAKGFTKTFTATANDSITPDSWEVTSDSANATVTETHDGSVCTVTITGVTVAEEAVTITVKATKGEQTATKTYAVTVKEPEKVTLYSQDFESLESTTTDDVTTYTVPSDITVVGGTGSIKTDSENATSINNYFMLTQGGGSGQRNAYLTLSNVPTSGTYYVEFDAWQVRGAMSVGDISVTNTKPSNNTSTTAYLFREIETAKAAYTFYINTVDEDTSITLACTAETWYHHKLVIDIDKGTIYATITKLSDGTSLVESVELDPTDTTLVAKYINIVDGRASTTAGIDNVEVYNYQ
ncbi:MAG: hypothetical protein K6G80_11215 [Treponema sp.]|nr:hypothetical protein [Treponema sp.]